MILLSGKEKTHDKSVGTDLGSFAGRRPSAKEGASPKRAFISINDRLGTFFLGAPLRGKRGMGVKWLSCKGLMINNKRTSE
ncbi:MAG: hypothetical protein ACI9NY_000318 [Kiritimatiellia bacterium]|jgi:hypothetical protein